MNAPGALVWNELQSPAPDASGDFYSALFGWEVEQFPGMDRVYLAIKNAGAEQWRDRERAAGGSAQLAVYFGTEDTEAALAKVTELGGSVLAGPTTSASPRSASWPTRRARCLRSTRASSRTGSAGLSCGWRCRSRCAARPSLGLGGGDHRGALTAERAPTSPGVRIRSTAARAYGRGT